MKNNFLIVFSLTFVVIFSMVFWGKILTGESLGVQEAEAIQYCQNYSFDESSDTGVSAYISGGSPTLKIKAQYQ